MSSAQGTALCISVCKVVSICDLPFVVSLYTILMLRCPLSTFGCRTFAVAGPTLWNSLADELPTGLLHNRFKAALKTSPRYLIAYTAHWRLCGDALYKFMINVIYDIIWYKRIRLMSRSCRGLSQEVAALVSVLRVLIRQWTYTVCHGW